MPISMKVKSAGFEGSRAVKASKVMVRNRMTIGSGPNQRLLGGTGAEFQAASIAATFTARALPKA